MPKVPPKNKSAAKSTVSSPAQGLAAPADDPAARQAKDTDHLAAAFPSNKNKPNEYGQAARKPTPGPTAEPADRAVTASTLTETTPSAKTGTQARGRARLRRKSPPGPRRASRGMMVLEGISSTNRSIFLRFEVSGDSTG